MMVYGEAMMLALRIKGKTMNQGIWAGSRSRKVKEMDTPMEPPEELALLTP